MAFMSLTALQQKVIRRLSQVPGAGAQLYSEDLISDYIQETFQQVRAMHFWDHLMYWHSSALSGTDGLVTNIFTGAADGYKDVQAVCYGSSSAPLPLLGTQNPSRLTGTVPRYIEPLRSDLDGNNSYLFRVWPVTAVTVLPDKLLQVRYRKDPSGLFTDPTVVVPFDAAVLINGAAYAFAADDGANPAQVEKFGQAYKSRLAELEQQHNSGPIILDSRMQSLSGTNQWTESPW